MNILSKFAACFFLVGLTLAKAQDNQVEAFPVIEFETPVYQFGTVQQGEEEGRASKDGQASQGAGGEILRHSD